MGKNSDKINAKPIDKRDIPKWVAELARRDANGEGRQK